MPALPHTQLLSRTAPWLLTALATTALWFTEAGCSDRSRSEAPIAVDGSSTVFPISEAAAEAFHRASPARVTVASSGTGGGMKKICRHEIAIAGASRPATKQELEACAAAKVELIELPIAFDGIAIVVHKDNDWAKSMTVAELKRMWEPQAQAKVMRWSDVRPGWPNEELHLFGAGVDSGTYDYFTRAVVGREHESRGDYTASEDDNVLVTGVANDKNALGFFGLAYFEHNTERLRAVAIDDDSDKDGAGPILPSPQTVRDGTYQPLSRPLFLYVDKEAASRVDVARFVDHFLEHAPTLVPQAGFVALPDDAYRMASRRFAARTTGSLYGGSGSKIGVSILELLAGEG